MWVLRKIQSGGTSWDNASPWKGCLHIDQEGRAWYATDLAKPTQFASLEKAGECAKIVRERFDASLVEIQVAVYEEVFQKPLPIPLPDIVTVTTRAGVQIAQLYPSSWNWNNDGEEYDIPF